jgi:hypothetical protein
MPPVVTGWWLPLLARLLCVICDARHAVNSVGTHLREFLHRLPPCHQEVALCLEESQNLLPKIKINADGSSVRAYSQLQCLHNVLGQDKCEAERP